MASLTLGEKFYLGGIIGAVLIIMGLYFVLWGKSEERARIARDAAVVMPSSAGEGAAAAGIIRSAGKQASSMTKPLLLPSSTENV